MAEGQLFEKYGQVLDGGKIIFKEGDDGEQMFIIQEGKVRISRRMGDGEHVLAILGKGDFFGEMAIVTREKRTATATAIGKTELLAFDRQGFTSMVEKNARIALNIIDKLCRRLQNANLQIQHLARKNLGSLVALNIKYAFEAGEKDKGGVLYDRTVESVSLSLSVGREDVGKVIDELVKAGIVGVAGNRISLVDPARLDEYSSSCS
jgi:CRP/FNR family cyclic AMP-dependent transcriptional regulator